METVVDTEPPEAPPELAAEVPGVEMIRLLSWKPSTNNTRIREYCIYYNDDSVSTTSTDTTSMVVQFCKYPQRYKTTS